MTCRIAIRRRASANTTRTEIRITNVPGSGTLVTAATTDVSVPVNGLLWKAPPLPERSCCRDYRAPPNTPVARLLLLRAHFLVPFAER